MDKLVVTLIAGAAALGRERVCHLGGHSPIATTGPLSNVNRPHEVNDRGRRGERFSSEITQTRRL
jgi:hypothetical protein